MPASTVITRAGRARLLVRLALGCAAAAGWASAAAADVAVPFEPLEQHEIEAGAWSAEMITDIASGALSSELQLTRGISDAFAVELEIDGDVGRGRFAVEQVGLTALVRLTGDDSAPVAAGAVVKLAAGGDGRFAGAALGLVAERAAGPWAAAANLMLRERREDGAAGRALDYAWSLKRRLGAGIALGAEGGGPLANSAALGDQRHFIGLSLGYQSDHGRGVARDLAVSLLREASRRGAAATVLRCAIQFDFMPRSAWSSHRQLP
ncbi:MAG: hypothetical protein ABIS38_10120 [Sphingomicrobium sp.]